MEMGLHVKTHHFYMSANTTTMALIKMPNIKFNEHPRSIPLKLSYNMDGWRYFNRSSAGLCHIRIIKCKKLSQNVQRITEQRNKDTREAGFCSLLVVFSVTIYKTSSQTTAH
jgi:hypothetical protein